MSEKKRTETASAAQSSESDLEGKMIIDSTGATIGRCKAVSIGDDGQIGLIFEVEINDVLVTPSKTIPYSAIKKITDVIELRVPIDITIAKSTADLKRVKSSEDIKEIIKDEIEETAEIKTTKEIIQEEATTIALEKVDNEIKDTKFTEIIEEPKEEIIPVVEPEAKQTETKTVDSAQSNATEQLSKALPKEEKVKKEVKVELDGLIETDFKIPKIKELMIGLEESIGKLDKLFKLLAEGDDIEKIEVVKALTFLTKLSPELGLSLIQSMMKLSDDPQQNVRLAIAEQLEVLGQTHPELFKGYFLEIFENVYDEPLEDVREHLIKTLQNIASKMPEIAIKGLEEFLGDVIIGNKVPEVPAKVIHDGTLKVVSGSFQLTRIAIKVRLQHIVKGGKLGTRCVEELEDYNATLIGLTIIESFNVSEANKIIKSATFKKLGSIFIEVILQMVEAYSEGSFKMLEEVIDKKIKIPNAVIERFYEIKVKKTLEGAKNIPMEVFLENTIIEPDEAEQIIYRLIVQQRINAAITMNNGRTFITSMEPPESFTKPKSTAKKAASTTKSTVTKKTSSTTKKPSTIKKKPTTTKKTSSNSTKKTTTTKKKPTAKKTTK